MNGNEHLFCESAFINEGQWLKQNSIITITKHHNDRRWRLRFSFCEAVSGEFTLQTGKQVKNRERKKNDRLTGENLTLLKV